MTGPTNKVIADGIRLADGSILDFGSVDPPEAGTVLFNGGNEQLGFQHPQEVLLTDYEGVVPATPVGFGATASVYSGTDGLAVFKLVCSWLPVTTDEDDDEILGIKEYRLYANTTGAADPMTQIAVFDPATASGSVTIAQTNCTYYLQLVAVSLDDDEQESSPAAISVVVPAGESVPTAVTNLVLTPITDAAVVMAKWDGKLLPSLRGYRIQFMTSLTTVFGAWTTPTQNDSIFLGCAPGVDPSTQWNPPSSAKYIKARVRAELFSGVVGAWSADAAYVAVGSALPETAQQWKDKIVAAGGISLNDVGSAGAVINGVLAVDKIGTGALAATSSITVGSGNNKLVLSGGGSLGVGLFGYFNSATPGFQLTPAGVTIVNGTINTPTMTGGTITGTSITGGIVQTSGRVPMRLFNAAYPAGGYTDSYGMIQWQDGVGGTVIGQIDCLVSDDGANWGLMHLWSADILSLSSNAFVSIDSELDTYGVIEAWGEVRCNANLKVYGTIYAKFTDGSMRQLQFNQSGSSAGYINCRNSAGTGWVRLATG